MLEKYERTTKILAICSIPEHDKFKYDPLQTGK